MTKNEMLKILRDNKELLENNEFQKFYKEIDISDAHFFTDLFLKSGINPLQYMKIVPPGYAWSLNIKHIDIPNHIEHILSDAFRDCKLLKYIVLPDNVEEVWSSAFLGCKNLESFSINSENSKLEVIGSHVFDKCPNLQELFLPKSLMFIEPSAFGDQNLTIFYNGSKDDWDKIIKKHNSELDNARIYYNEKV